MQNENSILLDGKWKLYIAENKEYRETLTDVAEEKQLCDKGVESIDATVPGNFELDMQKAGLIEDLFFDDNILDEIKLENRHLFYVKKFNIEDADNFALQFDGVDTIAEYFLNGEKIGESENMFITHTFDAKNLKVGENELLVHIFPAKIAAEKHKGNMLYSVEKRTFIRKAQSMFGWDIMPRIISGGIWKSVNLIKQKDAKIEEVYLRYYSDVPYYGAVYYSLDIDEDEYIGDYSLAITGEIDGEVTYNRTIPLKDRSGLIYGVEGAPDKLWWPKNMGKQNLYNFTYKLYKGDKLCDEKQEKHGFRTVKLERTDYIDNEGNGEFKFIINGVPFFAMGTNWVPLDAYPSRYKERLQKAMELVEDCGANIIRCWGGNTYENDEFYDYCDEHGIVVWQDFSMACNACPNTDEFLKQIREEAEKVILRLRHHPSIILWSGDNEIDSCLLVKGLDPNRNKITREVLADVINECDVSRPYLPSSPYVSAKAIEDKMDHRIPEDHIWGVRYYYKQDYFGLNKVARFASEWGYHGCNSPESIKKFMKPENVWPWDNDVWRLHSTCYDLEDKGDNSYYRINYVPAQIKTLFGDSVPDNLEDFALASQISQAEAFKYYIELFRSSKWDKFTGLIWWNLLDGWPQISDAVVDYYYYRKLAYFNIKRSQETVCVMVNEYLSDNENMQLYVANETLTDKNVSYKVKDISTDKVILQGSGVAKANASNKLDSIKAITEQTLLLIEYEVDGKVYKNHYLTGAPEYDYNKLISVPKRDCKNFPAPIKGKTFDYKKVKEWLEKADLLQLDGF